MSDTPTPTPTELDEQAFQDQLPRLLEAHRGKFALFAAGAFVDAFDSFQAAYDAGVDQFGLKPFFVGRVEDRPTPEQAPALQHGLIHADL